jgi:hypothetical protein
MKDKLKIVSVCVIVGVLVALATYGLALKFIPGIPSLGAGGSYTVDIPLYTTASKYVFTTTTVQSTTVQIGDTIDQVDINLGMYASGTESVTFIPYYSNDGMVFYPLQNVSITSSPSTSTFTWTGRYPSTTHDTFGIRLLDWNANYLRLTYSNDKGNVSNTAMTLSIHAKDND